MEFKRRKLAKVAHWNRFVDRQFLSLQASNEYEAIFRFTAQLKGLKLAPLSLESANLFIQFKIQTCLVAGALASGATLSPCLCLCVGSTTRVSVYPVRSVMVLCTITYQRPD